MYVKLFASMFEGSLGGQKNELLVFLFMLAKADADGVVDIHPKNFASVLGMTIEEVRAALVNLQSPDPDSRTPDEEGRRIVLLNEHRDWGWWIVNYEKYKHIRDAEDRREQYRESKRRCRKRDKELSTDVHKSPRVSTTSTHTDTDTDTDKSVCVNQNVLESSVNKKDSVNSGEMYTEQDFRGPAERRPEAPTFGDPLSDFAPEVAAEARLVWQKYAMEHHGNALRNLHSDSTHKELRHFAKALTAFGQQASAALAHYYQNPPKADKQLHAYQIIKKLGLEHDNDALSKTAKEKTKKQRLAEITSKKAIDFG